MAEGHMEGGKFRPHKNKNSSDISSDKVQEDSQPEKIKISDAQKLKENKS